MRWVKTGIRGMSLPLIVGIVFWVACSQAPAASLPATLTPMVTEVPEDAMVSVAETEVAAGTIETVAAPATPTPMPTVEPANMAGNGATAMPATPEADVATPEPESTHDPYAGLTIADLAQRSYGGGELRAEEIIHVTDAFTRTLVSYDSDGLNVYGFLNVPFGEGPFPVALVLHGYIPPRQYGTIGYTTRYADYLARAGYLVVHPNYRNHPPSDETAAFAAGLAEGDFRVGYAVDVLNLMAIIREHGGQPGLLRQADAGQMHLLGHSMGGGIALRIATVDPQVDAVVLYGSMSGDEAKNFERIQVWSNGESGAIELATPQEDLQRISPVYHLDRIEAAISIHHGDMDDIVPVEWSDELCQKLTDMAKPVECFRYPGAPHSFHDEVDRLFVQRVLDFFNRH